MNKRWVTLVTAMVIFSSTMVFGQKEASVRWAAPIVATVTGFDTGITVVNLSSTPLVVTNFMFFAASDGAASTSAEAATVDQINRRIAGLSFNIPGNGRFSQLASQFLGSGVNGQLRFSVIGAPATSQGEAFQSPTGLPDIRHVAYEAIFDSNFTTDTLKAVELTSRDRSPQK